MAVGLINKLTNFIMAEEEYDMEDEPLKASDRRAQLKVHEGTTPTLKVYVTYPKVFDDVRVCADYLNSNMSVIVNFESTDSCTKQRICDFLEGVTFVTGGSNQKVSDGVTLFASARVDITQERQGFSLPPYIKRIKDL
ncbi:MAG: sepF 1 [Firmicutes bacterium]|nr:sepF 1 [Bacillota bacterium]